MPSLSSMLVPALLVALGMSQCVNPSQPPEQCTECVPTAVLISGRCFPKIRGCLRHLAGPVCSECQSGYVLTQGTCVREAEFNNNTTNSTNMNSTNSTNTTNMNNSTSTNSTNINNTNTSVIPPVVIDKPPTLTQNELKLLTEQYGQFFVNANNYFQGEYRQLVGSTVTRVQKLQARTGSFLIIEYSGVTKDRFIAVAYLENEGLMQLWSFGNRTDLSADPIAAVKRVRQALGDQLKNHTLYQVTRQQALFNIDFLSPGGQFLRATLQPNSTTPKTLTLALSDIALEAIRQRHPYLQAPTSAFSQSNFHIFQFGPTLSISFTFFNQRLVVNRPFEQVPPVYTLPQTRPGLVGGWSEFANYSDPRLQVCLEMLAAQLPQLIGARVSAVYSQVVAGTNFWLQLRKTQPNAQIDEYETKVWYTLQDVAKLTEARRNARVIYTGYHNYNADASFTSNYEIVQAVARVVNIPPIVSVGYKESINRKYYRVLYSQAEAESQQEYAQFEVYTDTGVASFLSYTIDGEDIATKLNLSRSTPRNRTIPELLSFITARQPASSNSLLRAYLATPTEHTLTLVNQWGTFRAVLADHSQQLQLLQYVKVSDVSCYEMGASEVEGNGRLGAIDQHLRAGYGLGDYALRLVQVKASSNSIGYRLMYASSRMKQVQIYLNEVDNIAKVTKASYINYGYELVESSSNEYSRMLNVLRSADVNGSKLPFYVESNGTHIKGYYDDGRNTLEIQLSNATGRVSTQILTSRARLLIPEGFAFDSLIVPGTAVNASTNATLTRIYLQALKKFPAFISNAVLVFADRRNTAYLLMYRNINGYLRLEASVADSSGIITLGKLLITSYRDTDFSNCRQYSLTGKCLSCTDVEVQYQGRCHAKMEGCLVQPGAICVRCDPGYVKYDNRCFRDCQSFFA